MNDSERLDYVIGQVAALKAFCITLICLHPAPRQLATALEKFAEMGVAKTLPTRASDAMIEGMETMKAHLLSVAQDEAKRRGGP